VQIGVVALQGDFSAHQHFLKGLGQPTIRIKTVDELMGVDAVVLPGGETTTQIKLLKECGLWQALDQRQQEGMPIFATCAGAILCAGQVSAPHQESFGWLPVSVERNSYGDQRHSFETFAEFGGENIELVFIRAPRITKVHSNEVNIHLVVEGNPVLVEYKNVLAATFHPEISTSEEVYQYWLRSVRENLQTEIKVRTAHA
jgi:5'-phosphate synthase pdxT subunit